MKIRTGFVSNSSSSSFVGWGVSFDNENKFEEAYQNANNVADPFFEDAMSDLEEKSGLYIYFTPWEELLVGLPYTKMKLDETKREFHNRIASKIKKYLGEESLSNIGIIDQSWYDG